jgi:hypothetical protein
MKITGRPGCRRGAVCSTSATISPVPVTPDFPHSAQVGRPRIKHGHDTGCIYGHDITTMVKDSPTLNAAAVPAAPERESTAEAAIPIQGLCPKQEPSRRDLW